jgi:adenylate cyclase
LGAQYSLKEYLEALPLLREFASRVANVRQGHIWLAADLVQLGQIDEVRAEATKVLRLDPKYTIEGTQRLLALNKRPGDSEHLTVCARRARGRDSKH